MADKNDGGDKTEQPTPKKLQDARKKGNVPKSKDVTSTVELLVWLVVAAFGLPYAAMEISHLMQEATAAIGQPFALSAPALGQMAVRVLLLLTALTLLPVALIGLITEFLQAGPVFAADKLKPKMENLNPVEGIKRMFTLDNLVELFKSIAKTALLGMMGWWIVAALLPQLPLLLTAPAQATGSALWEASRQLLVWTVVVFILVSILDAVWQRHSFTKKMRMSRRDMKQEAKDAEGDPYVKQQRQQAHQEWSQQHAAQAARQANVLVVNPTHVAIAIDYDRETCPVPTVRAKGEELMARAMREAAEEAGVPIVRNVDLARALLADTEVDDIVPAELFDIVAEVILWAREVRDEMKRQAAGSPADPPLRSRMPTPGEDLSRYPQVNHPSQPMTAP